MMSGEMFPIPLQDHHHHHHQQHHQLTHHEPNPSPKPISNLKKKRNLPGTPDPEAEVMALSPKSLMATNRFVCEICNKGFQRDQNLQLHRRGHNLPWKLKQRNKLDPIKKKVYICPEVSCVHHDPSRALGDLTGIKKHFSRKHGEKKWKCEKCSKKYAVQSDWKAHSKTCGRIFFITSSALFVYLAEESVRLGTPNSLGLKNEGLNESMMNPNHQPNFPHGFAGMTQFGSGFRPEFGDQNKPRLSLWLDQANSQLNLSPMDQMNMNSNLYMSSSSAGLADMVNVFGSSSMMPINANSNPMPTLLQKAAQMGSTRSNPSVFGTSFGLMNTSSTTSNTAVSLVNNNITSLPHMTSQLQASTAMNNNSSNSSPQASNLDHQQMKHSRNDAMAPMKMKQLNFHFKSRDVEVALRLGAQLTRETLRLECMIPRQKRKGIDGTCTSSGACGLIRSKPYRPLACEQENMYLTDGNTGVMLSRVAICLAIHLVRLFLASF
ncbi:zinc finger protein JACKDAW-like protein [Tanacetum coccineum]